MALIRFVFFLAFLMCVAAQSNMKCTSGYEHMWWPQEEAYKVCVGDNMEIKDAQKECKKKDGADLLSLGQVNNRPGAAFLADLLQGIDSDLKSAVLLGKGCARIKIGFENATSVSVETMKANCKESGGFICVVTRCVTCPPGKR